MTSLFRPEVAAAQRQQWLGSIRLVRPWSLSVITAGAVAILLAVGAFISFGQYTRKAHVTGLLMPDTGLIKMASPLAGVVVQRPVSEGQAVRAGQVLFVLSVERGSLTDESQAQVQRSLNERQRSLQEAATRQTQLAQAQGAALEQRLQQMQREQAQIDAELALLQERLALARGAHERLEALREQQFIASAQLQTKADEILALRAQAQALQRQGAVLGRERAALAGEQRAVPLQLRARLGEVERELATLSREAAEQGTARQIVVRAPQDGQLSTVLAQSGQSVAASTVLASLVPAGAKLQAHLYAPSSAVGFLKASQPVRLRYEAFPYQKFGHQAGQVLQVSRTPLSLAELAQLPLGGLAGAAGEPMFRVTVALDDEARMPEPLVAGMRLSADVMLERRRLIEWLMAPFAGLKARV